MVTDKNEAAVVFQHIIVSAAAKSLGFEIAIKDGVFSAESNGMCRSLSLTLGQAMAFLDGVRYERERSAQQ